jgi:hypothetical protein
MADTVRVVVLPYRIMTVKIVWDSTNEVTTLSMSTDIDVTRLRAGGFDQGGVFRGFVNVNWNVTGDPIGIMSPAFGTNSTLELTHPGTGYIVIDYQGRFRDTTSAFTITAGTARRVVITPHQVTLYTNDQQQFTVTGYDQDNNITTDLGTLTWGTRNAANTITTTGVYTANQRGTDTVTARSSLFGARDSALVTVVPKVDTFLVRIDKSEHYLKQTARCTLLVADISGQVITDFNQNPRPIRISTRAKVLINDVWQMVDVTGHVALTGSGVVDTGNGGYLPANTAFSNGRLAFTVGYDAAWESLFVYFVEDSTLVDGVSPGMVWLDPEIISRLTIYPSPIKISPQHPLTIEYFLKSDAVVSVVIASNDGSLVMKWNFTSGQANGGRKGFNHFPWDGKNRHNKTVGAGAYIIKIAVDAKEGSVVKTKKIGVSTKR